MSSLTNQKTPSETGKFPQNFTQKNGKNLNSTSRPKGKSKFAQKSRVNANKKTAVAKQGPVFTYLSKCCSAPATKKPCMAVNKKDALVQGLGKFRCSACKKVAKVTVSKFKEAEVPVLAELRDALNNHTRCVEALMEVPLA